MLQTPRQGELFQDQLEFQFQRPLGFDGFQEILSASLIKFVVVEPAVCFSWRKSRVIFLKLKLSTEFILQKMTDPFLTMGRVEDLDRKYCNQITFSALKAGRGNKY